MALIRCDFHSRILERSTTISVILPEPKPGDTPTRHATLWLLHGLGDDHAAWLRHTSIERYVASLPLAVVMPDAGRSYYNDMYSGERHWTFLNEELPFIARACFPLSDAREKNFIAGLSMGGYGALKFALNHPERYAAAASLSGSLDKATPPARNTADMIDAFGDLNAIAGTNNDLFHLATQLAQSDAPRPALYHCCGAQDTRREQNVRFRDHARSLGLDILYEENPGRHDWRYWDKQIQHVLKWLPLPKK